MRMQLMKSLFSTFLVVALACCSSQQLAQAGGKSDCVIVRNADISTSPSPGIGGYEDNMLAANAGHQVGSGTRTVLLIRVFKEEPGVVDSQNFTKITGYLPVGIESGANEILKDFSFSSGWSGFVYKGDFWSSRNFYLSVDSASGMPRSGGVIRLSGSANAYNSYRKESKEFRIELSCHLVERALVGLSPWMGGEGDAWGSFYP
jgi:hypothetical protein